MAYGAIQDRIVQQIKSLETNENGCRPFKVCQEMADYTKMAIDQENIPELKGCLARMLSAYRTTHSNMVRTAIENVYVYSLSSYIMCSEKRQRLLGNFPKLFRGILTRQMTSCGI